MPRRAACIWKIHVDARRRASPARHLREDGIEISTRRSSASPPLVGAPVLPAHARRFTQMFVTLMQAGVLLSSAASPQAQAVAEGFCATRLDIDSGWGAVFGAGSAALDALAILRRAWEE